MEGYVGGNAMTMAPLVAAVSGGWQVVDVVDVVEVVEVEVRPSWEGLPLLAPAPGQARLQ